MEEGRPDPREGEEQEGKPGPCFQPSCRENAKETEKHHGEGGNRIVKLSDLENTLGLRLDRKERKRKRKRKRKKKKGEKRGAPCGRILRIESIPIALI